MENVRAREVRVRDGFFERGSYYCPTAFYCCEPITDINTHHHILYQISVVFSIEHLDNLSEFEFYKMTGTEDKSPETEKRERSDEAEATGEGKADELLKHYCTCQFLIIAVVIIIYQSPRQSNKRLKKMPPPNQMNQVLELKKTKHPNKRRRLLLGW